MNQTGISSYLHQFLHALPSPPSRCTSCAWSRKPSAFFLTVDNHSIPIIIPYATCAWSKTNLYKNLISNNRAHKIEQIRENIHCESPSEVLPQGDVPFLSRSQSVLVDLTARPSDILLLFVFDEINSAVSTARWGWKGPGIAAAMCNIG